MTVPLKVQMIAVLGTTAVSLLGFYLLMLWRKEIEQRQLKTWQVASRR
jgi:hypothetical protein